METPAISPEQAADALKQVAAAEKRSAQAYRYQRFAPYLFLWGVIWIIGYGASDLVPHWSGWIWLGLILVALAVSIALGQIAEPTRPESNWRIALSFTTI